MPSPIHPGRYTARIDGTFVVFLIGFRVRRWSGLPAARRLIGAMRGMPRELKSEPGSGLLGFERLLGPRGMVLVQCWRSFDALHAYAHRDRGLHRTAWAAFVRESARDPAVGIWHETYPIEPDHHESIYVDMPVIGLAAAARHVPAEARLGTALERLGREAA